MVHPRNTERMETPMTQSAPRRARNLASGVLACLMLAACGAGDGGGDTTAPERAAELTVLSSAYVDDTLEAILANEAAMAVAGQLYEMHCADCHGQDGRGARGITDLTEGRFAYGTDADAIRTTIRDGRHSEMPGLGREYGEVELGQIVAYVETLGTGATLNDYESRGAALYAEGCADCHGEDGQGLPALGAPDLTDDYWQHGASMMNVRLAITRGTVSECPAHGGILTPVEIELLTAWVLEAIDS